MNDSSKTKKKPTDVPPEQSEDENITEQQPEIEVNTEEKKEPIEDKKPDTIEKAEETTEETVEPEKDTEPIETEVITEEEKIEPMGEKEPVSEEVVEQTTENIQDSESTEKTTDFEGSEDKAKKPSKPEEKKKEKQKKVDRGPDFKYIVRFSNTDVDGEKNIVYGLTSVKGIGVKIANLIAVETGINRNMKIGDLTDTQIEKIQENIDNVSSNAPDWMLNHRKDYETGQDVHLISSDIDMKLRDEINIMKKIRSYRGIRHERGLTVRGQRTRANNRKGLSLGVSKKRVKEGK